MTTIRIFKGCFYSNLEKMAMLTCNVKIIFEHFFYKQNKTEVTAIRNFKVYFHFDLEKMAMLTCFAQN